MRYLAFALAAWLAAGSALACPGSMGTKAKQQSTQSEQADPSKPRS